MVTQLGIDIVKAIQSIGNSFFDVFFNMASMFGEEVFIILVLLIVYFGINKRFGEYMGLSLMTTLLVNTSLKNIFKADRPFQADSGIVNKRPATAGGFSFPSGHSQSASTTFWSLYAYGKKKWLLVLSVILPILVMVSRMYLGVHFPKDVIVGGVLGVVVSFGTYWIYSNCKRKFLVFGLIGLAFTPFLFLAKTHDFFTSFGLFYGVLFGIIVENKYVNLEMTKCVWRKIGRIFVALALVLVAKEGLKLLLPSGMWSDLIRYFFVAFMGIGVSPFVIKAVKL